MSGPVTILDVAKARGVHEGEGGGISGGEFDRVGLPIMGGCEVCGATVAAYNACPSKTGNLRCANGCIVDQGFATVDEFEAWDRKKTAAELVRDAISDLHDKLTEDDDPHNSKLAEILDAVEIHDDGTWDQ